MHLRRRRRIVRFEQNTLKIFKHNLLFKQKRILSDIIPSNITILIYKNIVFEFILKR